MIYRDVHVFVNRTKKFVIIFENEIIRNNLYKCLKNSALIWHIILLIEKKSFILKENIKKWCITFIEEFRESSVKIMKCFVVERYIFQNAAQNKQSKYDVQIVIRLKKFVEFFIYNQLFQIWNKLNVDFQLHITKLINIININDFLRELKDKKKSWKKFVASKTQKSNKRKIKNTKKKRDKNKKRNLERHQFSS